MGRHILAFLNVTTAFFIEAPAACDQVQPGSRYAVVPESIAAIGLRKSSPLLGARVGLSPGRLPKAASPSSGGSWFPAGVIVGCCKSTLSLTALFTFANSWLYVPLNL